MLVPIRDRIVVLQQRDDIEHLRRHAPTKVIVTTAPLDDTARGEVLAVGEGYIHFIGSEMQVVPLTVKVGDVVVFKSDAGMKCVSYGREYKILQEQHVLAIERVPETP